jgi:hypothetical protein
MNLAQNLEASAFFFPHRPALRQAGSEWTYAQLNDEVKPDRHRPDQVHGTETDVVAGPHLVYARNRSRTNKPECKRRGFQI